MIRGASHKRTIDFSKHGPMVKFGQKCITISGADPGRGMSVGEAYVSGSQLVDVGRGSLSAFRVVALDIFILQVIGEDNN